MIKKTKTTQVIIILCLSLFISLTYNIWWVSYERSGNEKTIKTLNKYIEMSRDVILAQEELRRETANYGETTTIDLVSCFEGSLYATEDKFQSMSDKLDEIAILKNNLEKLFVERTNFANTTNSKIE